MANIWEEAISILAENLNLGRSYLITTVMQSSYSEVIYDILLQNWKEGIEIAKNQIAL